MTPDPRPDAEAVDSLQLVRRAQDGDAEALERVFARYYDRVQAIVERRLGPEMRKHLEVDDILQETMVHAIQGFERFELRTGPELLGWFAQLVENRIRASHKHLFAPKRDHCLERHLQSPPDDSSNAATFQPAADETGPEDVAERNEELDLVEGCLKELDPRFRQILLLRHADDATWETIARVLEKPSPDAARMTYARAKIELLRQIRRRTGKPT
jgi:RNA polymerase sigma-70 factor (ECF subfamily)